MDDHAVFPSHSDFPFKVGRDEYALTDEAELASATPDHGTVPGEGQQAGRQRLADLSSEGAKRRIVVRSDVHKAYSVPRRKPHPDSDLR